MFEKFSSSKFFFGLICLILLNLSIVTSQEVFLDESIYDTIKNAIKITNYNEEVGHLTNTTDIVYLEYFYKKLGNNSMTGAYYLNRIEKKLDYLAKVLLIDCDNIVPKNLTQCNVKSNKTDDPFPQIKLLIPPMMRFNHKTKKMNQFAEINYNKEGVSEFYLHKFITENIPSFVTVINNTTLPLIMSQPLFNKILLFTEKPETPLIFKGLSNLFYDRILFGEVKSNNTEIVDMFNVTKFPTVIAIERTFGDETVQHVFTGKTNIEDIAEFINPFALRKKSYVGINEFKNPSHKELIPQITSENYEDFFSQTDERKIVYFTNGDVDVPEHLIKFAEQTKGYFTFAKMNCKNVKKLCKSEMYVDVDRLPQLILFKHEEDFYEMVKKNKEIPSDSFEAIEGNILKRLQPKIKTIKPDEDIKPLITADKNNNKYSYFSSNKNLPFKIISAIDNYTNNITFYYIPEFNKNIRDALQTKESAKDKSHSEQYLVTHNTSSKTSKTHQIEESYQSTYLGLQTFLGFTLGDYFFPTVPLTVVKQTTKEIRSSEDLVMFYRGCIYSKTKCALFFLDGDYDKQVGRVNLEYKHTMKMISRLPEEVTQIPNYFYVNATCHNEVAESFRVDIRKLPSVVVYDSKFQLFSKFKSSSEFNFANVEEFLKESADDTGLHSKLNGSEVIHKEKKCKEIQKKVQGVDYDKLERIKLGLEDNDEEEVENLIKSDF